MQNTVIENVKMKNLCTLFYFGEKLTKNKYEKNLHLIWKIEGKRNGQK